MNTPNIPLKHYYFLFTYITGAALIAVNILIQLFDFNINSGVNIALLMAGVFGVTSYFLKNNQRVPNKDERKRLSIVCFLISTLLSFVAAILIFCLDSEMGWMDVMELVTSASPLVFLGALLVALLFQYGLTVLFFYQSGKILWKINEKQSKK